jgi:tRNA nucleotidyltransferase/poly(A) polymerase
MSVANLKKILASEEELLKIMQLLGQARLVGGCVRDFILYNILVDDIDIATPLLPTEVETILAPYFKILPIGISHGTMTIFGKRKYEITTLRQDCVTDGRHAIVNFCDSWEVDSSRRDFTMNGLYADINGEIYDYHGGLNDLSSGCVRFIGDPQSRICEDYLRILRFVRFVARFGNYCADSFDACMVLRQNLAKLSRERITQEWFKVVCGSYFCKILKNFEQILNVIGMRLLEPYKNEFERLSALGKTTLFLQDDSLLLLSKCQKNYVQWLRNLKIANKTDALVAGIKYGTDFINDKMILDGVIHDISDLEVIKSRKFPINGHDLLELGMAPKEIGDQLALLYKLWIESNCSKAELLDHCR